MDKPKATWVVQVPKKVAKQLNILPERQKENAAALLKDLRFSGPVQGAWPNYSKLGKDRHHCHLAPKWVVCWEVVDRQIRVIEIYYIGSRKDAPY